MKKIDLHQRYARADMLLWIAELLGPPTIRRGTAGDPCHEDLCQLALASGLSADADNTALIYRVGELAQSTDAKALRGEHARLFEGGVACPPNETAWVRRDKGAILADIAGFYRAFGFTIDPHAGEKEDHLIAELQFTALLLVMLADAEQRGDEDAIEITRLALASFVDDHLGVWLDGFCDRLAATARLPLYAELSSLLLVAWRHLIETERLPRPADEVAEPHGEGGTPYECGLRPETGSEVPKP